MLFFHNNQEFLVVGISKIFNQGLVEIYANEVIIDRTTQFQIIQFVR